MWNSHKILKFPDRYLSAKLGNLHLFPTEIGKPSVDAEELGVYFKDSSKGCLKFRTADYTISVTLGGLSVVTVVVLALILGVLMALGLMFYHRGSKKRQTNAQPFQPWIQEIHVIVYIPKLNSEVRGDDPIKRVLLWDKLTLIVDAP